MPKMLESLGKIIQFVHYEIWNNVISSFKLIKMFLVNGNKQIIVGLASC